MSDITPVDNLTKEEARSIYGTKKYFKKSSGKPKQYNSDPLAEDSPRQSVASIASIASIASVASVESSQPVPSIELPYSSVPVLSRSSNNMDVDNFFKGVDSIYDSMNMLAKDLYKPTLDADNFSKGIDSIYDSMSKLAKTLYEPVIPMSQHPSQQTEPVQPEPPSQQIVNQPPSQPTESVQPENQQPSQQIELNSHEPSSQQTEPTQEIVFDPTSMPEDFKTWLSSKDRYKLKLKQKREESKKYWEVRMATLDQDAIKLKSDVYKKLSLMNKFDLRTKYYQWHMYTKSITLETIHINRESVEDMRVTLYNMNKFNLYHSVISDYLFIINDYLLYSNDQNSTYQDNVDQAKEEYSVHYGIALTIHNFKNALIEYIEKEKMTDFIELYNTLFDDRKFDDAYIEINPTNEKLLQEYIAHKKSERMKYLESKRVTSFKANQLVGIRDKANDIYLGQIISIIPYENHTIYYVRYIGFDEAFNEFINDPRRILPYNQNKKYRIQ